MNHGSTMRKVARANRSKEIALLEEIRDLLQAMVAAEITNTEQQAQMIRALLGDQRDKVEQNVATQDEQTQRMLAKFQGAYKDSPLETAGDPSEPSGA